MRHDQKQTNVRTTFPTALLSTAFFAAALASLFVAAPSSAQKKERGVRVVAAEAERRVDVFVDGAPFTSYVWPETLKKPVLYPLRAATGTPVTRGFPFESRAGERVDHPHHVGLWFNYGDVNGVDFWNNSDALKPEQQAKMGTILHRRVVKTKDGAKSGELEVESDWIMPGGKAVLRETSRFVFRADGGARAVDRVTTLTAQDARVVFKDNKEGVLGLRVRRELEQPSDKPEIYTDASGKPTAVAKLDNAGVSGLYRSSEGKTGDAVWGTRGRWTLLAGKVGREDLTLAILDHPQNPGYPTYWHARGYGLFAANPLGQAALSGGKDALNFTLEPKQSVTFRHRLLILSAPATPEQIEAQHQRFVEEMK